MARSASLNPVERFITNCTYLDDGAEERALRSAMSSRSVQDLIRLSSTVAALRSQWRDADSCNQMLYLDTKIFMTSLNLTYNDKMSMASSVEVRVPFLDRELAEFVAWNVPPIEAEGFLRPTTKYIFRQAMRDLSALLKAPP